MTTTIANANQKGGVGKTTTTVHMARAAVLQGLKVLCIDMDPQGNLTTALAPEVTEGNVGLADALSDRTEDTMESVLSATIWEGVDLIPTTGDALGFVRDELVLAGAGRESRLRDALEPIQGNYDLVLIDCCPALDQLTINALTAADKVLIITHSKLWSANGLARLLGTVDKVRKHYNSDLAISGVLVNHHEKDTTSGAHWLAELTEGMEARGLTVLMPPIPKSVIISDAHEVGKGLDEMSTDKAKAMRFAGLYSDHLTSILEGK